jgi:hypothetical protein
MKGEYLACPSCKDLKASLPLSPMVLVRGVGGVEDRLSVRQHVCLDCGTVFVESSELPGVKDVGL